MAGKGGHKHRARRLHNKRNQRLVNAKESLRRVQNQFESKGQTWEPQENPAQMSALTHDARRLVTRSRYTLH